MKKKELPIKFPEQYLPRLSELCIQKDVSPSEILTKAFECYYIQEQSKNDKKNKKNDQ